MSSWIFQNMDMIFTIIPAGQYDTYFIIYTIWEPDQRSSVGPGKDYMELIWHIRIIYVASGLQMGMINLKMWRYTGDCYRSVIWVKYVFHRIMDKYWFKGKVTPFTKSHLTRHHDFGKYRAPIWHSRGRRANNKKLWLCWWL